MREVIYKKAFKKQYKLMQLRGKEMSKLKQVITLLAHDAPLAPAYRDHALSGDFAGFRDLHIEPDWLLLYQKKEAKDFPEGRATAYKLS
ncbi:hypothetical protein CRENPOLYSF2_1450002 [Crenothrix polyspora]|uniref:Toxin of the YafQ-DinJ toxin-antitoxin system n=1 Tax=Crenothrix polyspora TaxID=360316 RepID=A0A1R4H1E8_9GAMM|nr:type II toxin-antitoxin system YafQ family toxin [Crenothrix polyspora]SJM90058.1 hypothetical protein CRENPOLYSF2_1450002 [Crenothrix polyspora]